MGWLWAYMELKACVLLKSDCSSSIADGSKKSAPLAYFSFVLSISSEIHKLCKPHSYTDSLLEDLGTTFSLR